MRRTGGEADGTHLALGWHADQLLALVRERHNRRRGARTLSIFYHLRRLQRGTRHPGISTRQKFRPLHRLECTLRTTLEPSRRGVQPSFQIPPQQEAECSTFPSITATQELVVPRSIPMTGPFALRRLRPQEHINNRSLRLYLLPGPFSERILLTWHSLCTGRTLRRARMQLRPPCCCQRRNGDGPARSEQKSFEMTRRTSSNALGQLCVNQPFSPAVPPAAQGSTPS